MDEMIRIRDTVAALRTERDSIKAHIKAATEDAIARINEEYLTELLTLSYLENEVEEREIALRQLAIEYFLETGSKKPIPGVGVREMTVVEYRVDKALAWAKKTGLCLKLDAVAFKKVAKANPSEVPATIKKVPQGTISKNLQAFTGIIPE